MKTLNLISIGIIGITLFTGCGESEGVDSNGGHYQGNSCATCHSSGEHSFASGATVFTNLHAINTDKASYAVGYKIQLGDSEVYNAGRGDGNSHLFTNSLTNFTAKVIDQNGNVVNSSTENSHNTSRLDCNSCHTATGNNGAPGRILNKRITPTPTPTPTAKTFGADVMPVLEAKCKVCHGSNGNFTITTASSTYANITALKGSAAAGGQYLLDKGSNSVGHGGGQVIATSSAEYATIKSWVDAGAANN